MKLDTTNIKTENIHLIRLFLQNEQSHTKNEIAEGTGLSKATCFNLLKELLHFKEIIELELASPNGGRPARRFMYNKEFVYMLSISVSVNNHLTIIDYEVDNIYKKTLYSRQSVTSSFTMEFIQDIVSKIISNFHNIKTISISIPGIVQYNKILDCDIPCLINSNLGNILETAFKINVNIYNDVNTAVYDFYNQLIDSNPEVLSYIYFPNNALPGMGTVVNGRLLKGHSNFSGEIKFLNSEYSFEEQLCLKESKTTFTSYLINVIQTVTSLLNPQYLVLSGEIFTLDMQEYILEECSKLEIKQHLPQIIFENNIQKGIINGLKVLGYNNLNLILKGE